MSLDLSKYVSGGEIINSRRNSVHGFVMLRGCERPIVLQLTGNLSSNLAGQHLCFEAREAEGLPDHPVTEQQINDLQVDWIQIGVPGDIRLLPEVGGLHLEWFGQNGQTVVELSDLQVEFVIEEDDKSASKNSDRPAPGDLGEDNGENNERPADRGLGVSFEPIDDVEGENWSADGDVASEEEEDPFGLFPSELTDSLRAETPAWSAEPDEATLAQWKEWDEVFEGTKDVPLSSLFDPPIQLPPVDSLQDSQASGLVNAILKQLALHNIAFHMCEHFTPRMAYDLLVNEILRDYGTHPELRRIGYTMNFDTSEFCDDCAAEFERDHPDLGLSPDDESSALEASDSLDLDISDDELPDDELPDDDAPF